MNFISEIQSRRPDKAYFENNGDLIVSEEVFRHIDRADTNSFSLQVQKYYEDMENIHSQNNPTAISILVDNFFGDILDNEDINFINREVFS